MMPMPHGGGSGPAGGDDFGDGGDQPSSGGGGGGVGGGVFDANGSGFFSSTRSSPRSQNSQFDSSGERFSRKVFVGGLPPDIDEGE